MKKFVKPSAEQILKELNIEDYLPSGSETTGVIEAARTALKCMEDDPADYRLHVDKVHKFMKVLWEKYDCEEIYQMLDSLTRIEPALLDLERDPEARKRYRDRYVHLFHVFVFGLRILSDLIQKAGGTKAAKILKIDGEQLRGRMYSLNEAGERVEWHDYSWKERMLFLWTLISTLHDIAIPITHLDNIRDALNKFSEKFHLQVVGPNLTHKFPADLDEYLWLISQLFEGKFEQDSSEEWLYNKPPSGAYIKGFLERLFTSNHGVLGGFLAYKMVEEIFLQGKSAKYKLNSEAFQLYRELILRQDVARAALAISLHDLRDDESCGLPEFMPLNFHDYPLTFILIIADSLQEYLRWEGMSIRGDTKLYGFPSLSVTIRRNKVNVECGFSVESDRLQQKYFIEEVKRMTANEGRSFSGRTIGSAADEFCKSVEQKLEHKVSLGSGDFTLSVSFFVGEDHASTKTFGT